MDNRSIRSTDIIKQIDDQPTTNDPEREEEKVGHQLITQKVEVHQYQWEFVEKHRTGMMNYPE